MKSLQRADLNVVKGTMIVNNIHGDFYCNLLFSFTGSMTSSYLESISLFILCSVLLLMPALHFFKIMPCVNISCIIPKKVLTILIFAPSFHFTFAPQPSSAYVKASFVVSDTDKSCRHVHINLLLELLFFLPSQFRSLHRPKENSQSGPLIIQMQQCAVF